MEEHELHLRASDNKPTSNGKLVQRVPMANAQDKRPPPKACLHDRRGVTNDGDAPNILNKKKRMVQRVAIIPDAVGAATAKRIGSHHQSLLEPTFLAWRSALL